MRTQRIASFCLSALAAGSLAASQPSVVLEDGGVQFPDGSVQETSAAVPDGPPTATVNVDCGSGDSIMDALKTPADELTIQISGMCHEIVVTSRPRVTFIGTSPMTDGIDASGTSALPLPNPLNLLSTHSVDVKNLKLTGGAGGIGIDDTFSIDVDNCRLEDNSFTGAFVAVGSSLIRFTDTVVTGNGVRGLGVTNGASFTCTRCTVDNNGAAGLGTGLFCSEGSSVVLVDSTVEGKNAVFASNCTIRATNGTLEAKPDGGGSGLAMWAMETSAVSLTDTSVVGPIWASAGSSVVSVGITQTAAAGGTSSNRLSSASSLIADGTTSLIGGLQVSEFSTAVIGSDASVTGNLSCSLGGDALCEEPTDVTGTSTCAQCVKP